MNKMGTYPLSGIVDVFLLLVLVVAGCQTVTIFTNQDLTSFCLSKISSTGLWLFIRPFLYVFVDTPSCLDRSSIRRRVWTFHIQWGWYGEVTVSPGLLHLFSVVSLLSSIHNSGCWWHHLMQANLKTCSWILSAWSGLGCAVLPCTCVCQVSLDCGLALVSP